ncbi:MAG: hypothetical protein AAF936_15620 [Pseudomonadota bacterium]
MRYRKNEETKENTDTKTEMERSALPTLGVDYELYAHYLEHSDASEEDKRALVETLWSIIMTFVDMGFGVHPVQQAQQACGQLQEILPKPALTAPDEVKYPHGYLGCNFECSRKPHDSHADKGAE